MPANDLTKPWVVEDDDVELFEEVLGGLVQRFRIQQHPDVINETLHILEWGAGGSCLHYPEFLRDELIHPYVWFAIEHNPNVKHNSLAPRVDPYTFIIESPIPAITRANYDDMEWDPNMNGLKLYYCRIGELLRPHNGYHLIYVDGFYRYSCLELAQRLLHKDGILLMDNADRADPKRLDKLAFNGEFVKPHWWKATLRSGDVT